MSNVAPTPAPASAETLTALWNIQDTLLQQYRVIFVTMQSILLSFGGIAITRPNGLGLLICISGLVIVTMWLWLTICPARAKSVFFCQSLLLRAEQGEQIIRPLSLLKAFQSGEKPELRRDPTYLSLFGGGTKTSWKMNVLLPWLFIVVWVLFWVISILPLVHVEIKFITTSS